MMKKVLVVCLGLTLSVKADWLDDMTGLVGSGKEFPVAEAVTIVDNYRHAEEQELVIVEKEAQQSRASGFWDSVRDGAYSAQIATLNGSISYYKKIAQVFNGFSENKKEKETIIYSFKKLRRYKNELADIRSDYRSSKSIFGKIKIGTFIAAKEIKITAYRAYIKSLFVG